MCAKVARENLFCEAIISCLVRVIRRQETETRSQESEDGEQGAAVRGQGRFIRVRPGTSVLHVVPSLRSRAGPSLCSRASLGSSANGRTNKNPVVQGLG